MLTPLMGGTSGPVPARLARRARCSAGLAGCWRGLPGGADQGGGVLGGLAACCGGTEAVSACVTGVAVPRPGPGGGRGRPGSRAAAAGADLPHRATKAVFRAERPVRLAFRPGPAVSTLDSARRVKSGLARGCQQAGSGLTSGREQTLIVAGGPAPGRRAVRAGPCGRPGGHQGGASQTASPAGGKQS